MQLEPVAIAAPWSLSFERFTARAATLKPSELTPRCAALMVELVSDAGLADRIAVVQGGELLAAQRCALPLDQLSFTGSTRDLAR